MTVLGILTGLIIADSIKEISKQMTEDMLTFYQGDKPGFTPGLLPEPYYWWEAGAMMGSLIEYWYYTKDESYVDLTKQALLFQTGPNNDYMPPNQTLTEGNDDQGFWGLAVMSAAEYNFPHPEPHQPQWLALAQAVFNTQAARWDTGNCNGGLRWQIFNWNKGFDYKNSISNACFFALSARLALYTGNQTYADWAVKTWDWMVGVGFIDHEWWYVYDGAHIPTNCTNIVRYQFSYNAGGFILGAAALYNFTEDQVWKDRLDNLLEGSKVFFDGPNKDIMTEVACEPVNLCNVDQQSFKAYLSRWLATVTKWAPHTYDTIIPYLRTSAVAAAKQCVGGENGRMCGLKWSEGKYDGSTGVGQQMSAMEAALTCMIQDRAAPLTSGTGGTSEGDPNAGSGGDSPADTTPLEGWQARKITAGDTAGAAILTIVIILGLVAGIIWLMLDETSDESVIAQMKSIGKAAASAPTSIAAVGAGGVVMATSRKNEPVEKQPVLVSARRQNAGSRGDLEPQASAATVPTLGATTRRRM
ncbi:glycoside hydrolase family 76 protein [Stachybotrys elegans]|uniref:mannan endo-1,6-alpha-mannosidase n=1 Tax=Stachybotrys elegans TaxID=80388 RepID=A0A8K0WQX3_9HYPO|nr:glycoside hydrolase family 76 protein [Stachybotrys elegans]